MAARRKAVKSRKPRTSKPKKRLSITGQIRSLEKQLARAKKVLAKLPKPGQTNPVRRKKGGAKALLISIKPKGKSRTRKRKRTSAQYAEAARLGWERKRKKEALAREEAGLPDFRLWKIHTLGFTAVNKKFVGAAKELARFGRTHKSGYYERFREMKRDIYKWTPRYQDAYDYIYDACIDAGWDEEHAEIFAELS